MVKEDVVGVRPYGFDNGGDWFPTGLNEVFKFSRSSSFSSATSTIRDPDDTLIYSVQLVHANHPTSRHLASH